MVQKHLLTSLAVFALAGCSSGSGGNIKPETTVSAPTNSGGVRELYQPPAYVENNISGWDIRCEKDQADQSRYCNGSKGDLSIGVLKRADGAVQHRVVVGSGAVYPDSGQVLRIDNDAALESNAKGFNATESAQVIERMKTSTQVSTRYRHSPSGDYIQRTTPTAGFSSVMTFIYNTINSL